MFRTCVRLILVAALSATAALAPTTSTAAEAPGRFIVQLKPGASVAAAVDRAQATLGVRATQRFSRVLNGFAATLTSSQRAALADDPRVAAVVPDVAIHSAGDPYPLTDDEVQSGIVRVGATANPLRDEPALDVDIAVLDTGIQPDNQELNILGGYNCTDPTQTEPERAEPDSWRDSAGFGHGTHVAGIAAAHENGRGVAGVAQGARLWAIKVLEGNGNGYWSWVICGLDHIAGMREPGNSAVPRIEVVNMSIAGGGWDDGNCGIDNSDLFHQAICRLDAEGVTMIAAAGNSAADAANYVPGAYDEVITVSAMADWNGQASGSGSRPAGCTRSDGDDDFASFSNYGADVDLIAPGVCVVSTLPIDRLGLMSGTSMATPHVAGGAALYYSAEERLDRPRPTPQQVRAALVARGSADWQLNTDPDRTRPNGAREPALRINHFGLAADFEVGVSRHLVRAAPGATAELDVWVARLGGFATAVDLDLDEADLPPGANATFDDASVSLPEHVTRLTIDVPAQAAPGTYDIDLSGQASSQSSAISFRLVVFATTAGSGGPWLRLIPGSVAGFASVPVRVKWTAVVNAQRYEVQRRVDGANWTLLGKPYGTKLDTIAWPAQRNQFRVRVKVGGTWREWRTGTSAILEPFEPTDGVELSGSWSEAPLSSPYSEIPMYSTQAGATATFEFTGRSVAWISTKATNRGKARISIDGTTVKTIDLRAGSTRHRQIVFAQSWSSVGVHTMQIEVLGLPSSRRRVDLDALIVIAE